MTTSLPVKARRLGTPDGELYYELRGDGPLVALVGAPMDAKAFAPLADLLASDHTVLTADPRGIHRSVLTSPEQDSTPELRAADLARLLQHIAAGPATVLGSSGGAVTALSLAQDQGDLLDLVIAHEPPISCLLPDAEQVRRETEEMVATYLSGDRRGAWRLFLAGAGIDLPEEVLDVIVADPDDSQALADEYYSFAHMERGTTFWQPDLDRLRSSAARVVVGIGELSSGQLCDRTSRALAAQLGVAPVTFPGDHIGFVEDAAAFAVVLRSQLN